MSNYYPILWGLTIPHFPARFKLNHFPWDQIITPFPIGQNIPSYHVQTLPPPPFPCSQTMPPFSQEYNLLLVHPHSTHQITFKFKGLEMDARCRQKATGKRDGVWEGGWGLTSLVIYKRTYLMGPSSFFCPPLFKKINPTMLHHA